MENIVKESVEWHNYGYPANTIFFPFLVALQKPQMRELYKDINSNIRGQLRRNSSVAYGNSNTRIYHMLDISETLLTSDKLNEKDKIMVMLFAATCSELELTVWEMMQQGKSPALIKTNELTNCLLIDMGLSPRDPKDEAVIAAMSKQQKNEKVQDAARKIENFFRAIGVEVNDL
jgi:hypothetical protein